MVSNARLDLPDPESPVTTTRLSRGISTEMFLRLWTRAPCPAMVVGTAGRRFWSRLVMCGIDDSARSRAARPIEVEERQFLDLERALLRQPDRRRGLADQALVGE